MNLLRFFAVFVDKFEHFGTTGEAFCIVDGGKGSKPTRYSENINLQRTRTTQYYKTTSAIKYLNDNIDIIARRKNKPTGGPGKYFFFFFSVILMYG